VEIYHLRGGGKGVGFWGGGKGRIIQLSSGGEGHKK